MATSYAPYVPFVTSSTSFDGFAIAALVLGILGGSVLAIVFSIVALTRIKKKATRGKGMAITGLVLGILGTIAWLLIIVGIVFAIDRTNKVSYNDGWNAAKEFYESNYSRGDCTTAYQVSWIPSSDFEDKVIEGCRAFNNSYGSTSFRYPSNY